MRSALERVRRRPSTRGRAASSEPGPYRCRKSTLGILPCCTRRGKTSMKPSSIDEPGGLVEARTGRRHRPPAPPARRARRATTTATGRRARTAHRRTTSHVDVGMFEQVGQAPRWYPADGADPGCTAYRRGDRRDADLQWYADDLIARGIRRVHVLAWRDLDDPDAGGSEVHADEFMRRWAAAGLEVTHRTSAAVGAARQRTAQRLRRDPPREPVLGVPTDDRRRDRPDDGSLRRLVEIWNGVPWFSPVWCRTPRITILHHVHGPMWDQILPGPLAVVRAGARGSPRTAVLPSGPDGRRPSDATRDELLELGFQPDRVTAIPNGTDPKFTPGGSKTREPVDPRRRATRAGEALRAADRLGRRRPARRAGSDADDRRGGARTRHARRRWWRAGAGDWIRFAGRVDHRRSRRPVPAARGSSPAARWRRAGD